MKLAYLSMPYDVTNPFIYGHCGHYITEAIEKNGTEVDRVPLPSDIRKYLFAPQKIFHRIFTEKNLLLQREPFLLKDSARQNDKYLCSHPADALLAFGTLPFAFLKSALPKFVITGATFPALERTGYHFGKLARTSHIKGNGIEMETLRQITHIFISSRWAMESLIADFHVNPRKISLLSLGANLNDSLAAADISRTVGQRLKAHK